MESSEKRTTDKRSLDTPPPQALAWSLGDLVAPTGEDPLSLSLTDLRGLPVKEPPIICGPSRCPPSHSGFPVCLLLSLSVCP